jgi:site-specific DNA-methyltransferase (adenine-specific)
MFSFIGDVVLDPFLGSGTTSLAAKNLDRNSIGYEINRDFLPVIKQKIGIDRRELFKDDATFEIIEQGDLKVDFRFEIDNLPYIFRDPVKFDKKVDPRKFKFGSKIDGKERKETNLYSVKRVESPDRVELDTGLKVRLIGVKPLEEKRAEAIGFLQKLTKGQKVFLKFDEKKFDDQDNLLAYLYLKNKTFVNRHLIRSGLVGIEPSLVYFKRQNFN